MDVRILKKREEKKFVRWGREQYKEDAAYVPLLDRDVRAAIHTAKKRYGCCIVCMAYEEKTPVARILFWIRQEAGEKKAYFSLLEAADSEAGCALLNFVKTYAAKLGANTVIGPVSSADGEENLGILVEGEGEPSIFEGYNPLWYASFLERSGFKKGKDYVGVRIPFTQETLNRLNRLVKERCLLHGLWAYTPDRSYRWAAADIAQVLRECGERSDRAWRKRFFEMRALMDPELVAVVRNQRHQPVAFACAMPDYAPCLRRMQGRVLPKGWLAFARGKRELEGTKLLMHYCIPEYQNAGAILLAYRMLLANALAKGYRWGQGTVEEGNWRSLGTLRAAGGSIERRLRVYCCPLK